MLGIGVAEHSGFITTGIRGLLNVTSERLLTPMVILVGIVSHSAVDAGYVLVIPLGGVIFYAAGRHPLAGIAAAFAGVSGGFSANFVPAALDPLLQGLTQGGAQILDPNIQVNTLNNYLHERGMLISDGYGPLKGETFRIAHMGDVTGVEVSVLLDAMTEFLEEA